MRYPHLAEFNAWQFTADVDAKNLLTQQLVINQSTAEGVQSATQVQLAGVLDGVYGEAAAELDYFPMLEGNEASFTLWAPTAQQVSLVPVTYSTETGFSEGESIAMSMDSESGAWTLTTDQVAVGDYYQYQLTVYHPLSMQLETYQVADPYSLCLDEFHLFTIA